MAVKLTLRTGRPLPQGGFQIFLSVRGCQPQGHGVAERVKPIEEMQGFRRIVQHNKNLRGLIMSYVKIEASISSIRSILTQKVSQL
jgi:hypothetical protein